MEQESEEEKTTRYAGDLKIDMDALDLEWERQPVLYMHYAELVADAEKEKSELKEELDVLKAAVGVNIVKKEAKKPAEAEIARQVMLHNDVMAKSKEVINATYRAAVLRGAVEAFSQRKKALEKMVDLFVFGYNSSPKQDRVDRIRDVKKQRREEQGEAE